MPLLITPIKQQAQWAAVEGDQNASIRTQLVKKKVKRVAVEAGDYNASITTHIEKKHKAKKLKRVITTLGSPP